MPSRDWLRCAAAGGLLVLLCVGHALAQQQESAGSETEPVPQIQQAPYRQGPDAENQHDTSEANPLTPLLGEIVTAIRELVAEQRAANKDEPAEHEIQDLDAQKDMALWALLMVIVSAISTAVTGAGVWLVKGTLEETRKAAKHTEGMLIEAREANKAANAVMEVTRDIGMAQVRAYVSLSNFAIKIARATDGKMKPVIRFRYINSGQSPARKVRIDIGGSYQRVPTAEPGKNIEMVYWDPIGIVSRFFGDVGAGEGDTIEMTPDMPVSDKDYTASCAQRWPGTAIYIVWRLYYEDVFGHRIFEETIKSDLMTFWNKKEPLREFKSFGPVPTGHGKPTIHREV